MSMNLRLGIQQRVLPAYRIPFFDLLAQSFPAGVNIYAGQPWPGEAMGPGGMPQVAHFWQGSNLYLFDGRLRLVWQRSVQAWLNSFEPQVMILEANPRNLSNARVFRWMQKRHAPVLGWGLGAPPLHGSFASLQEKRRRNYLGKFDALITYSQKGAEEFVRAGFNQNRIFVAPNAITPRPKADALDRPVRLGEPAVVLFVGRLQPRKRVDDLLQACSGLPENIKPHLWIVGDGPARSDLQALAQKVYPHAQFFGDKRGKELDDLYDRADLFVLPGTGGLAVQEAMAHALPVIVAEADGTQLDLVRPENGWCLQPAGMAPLKAVLAQVLPNPLRLRQMGIASRQIVQDEVNIEKMVDVFIQAVDSVLSNHQISVEGNSI